MIFRQYLHKNPIAAAYLLGCGGQSKGIIVDPLIEEVDFYIEEAKNLGMNITHIIDTHLHADHISGGRLLAEKTGAAYVLHTSAATNYPFFAVEDGDEIVAGNVIINILHTPGHTPEHISLVIIDKTRGEKPWFVLTGHTLMVGDVGRTELAVDLEVGATDLYDSLFNKLLTLDENLIIYPGAFSGSVCGRKLSGNPISTINYEKRFNLALQITDKERFVQMMTENVPPKPEGFEQMRKTNMGYSV